MRKFFYSFVVLASFGLYALHQRGEAAAPLVVPQTSEALLPTPSSPLRTPSASAPPSPPLSSGTQPLQKTVPVQTQKSPPSIAPPTPTPAPQPKGQYHDGEYTGPVADAYYGNIQVRVAIAGGKITDVTFLQYPNDQSTSIYINSQAMPYLQQEAIQVQNENVDIISGATDSSMAFRQSLGGALQKAKG